MIERSHVLIALLTNVRAIQCTRPSQQTMQELSILVQYHSRMTHLIVIEDTLLLAKGQRNGSLLVGKPINKH